MEGLCFYSSKYRVTKGFKFHAQPQTGAYSCLRFEGSWMLIILMCVHLKWYVNHIGYDWDCFLKPF